MKSVVSTIAVLFAVATFTACSKKEEAPTAVQETPAVVVPTPTAPSETAQPAPAVPVTEPTKQEEKK
jgi:hypothetical protein